MKFKSEDEAYDYWEREYEPLGMSFYQTVNVFLEWVEENNVDWPGKTESYEGVF